MKNHDGHLYTGRTSATTGQTGSTLYPVIMILAVLTLLGITLVDMTVVDLKISRNHIESKQQLLLAESAALEGLQRLISSDLSDISAPDLFWVHDGNVSVIQSDLPVLQKTIWKKSHLSASCEPSAELVFTAVEKRKLNVIDLSKKNLHEYEITGVYNPIAMNGNGRVIVTLGFRKRF